MGHDQTTHPAGAASHGTHGHEEHGSMSTYVSVFVALLICTVISVAVGSSATLREKTPGVMMAAMMAVSTVKALLVILFFMHLKWEASWKYVLTIPCCIMSVFLLLMLIPDVGQRARDYAEERWLYAAEPLAHSDHGHDDLLLYTAETHSHDESAHGDHGHAHEKKGAAHK
jgi:cytochrome c oxidase subunit IV